MLDTLYIKNFAIINELEVNFHEGLNVLSGETGAGKSVIIGSVNFVLGGKADREIIKTGKDICEVSMLITVNNSNSIAELRKLDIEPDEEGCILIKRTFNINGKSVCRINGRPATVSILRQAASVIFDIHSQHDNHRLLNSKNHIDILDSLCPQILWDKKQELSILYNEYKSLQKSIKELDTDDSETQYRLDLYKYQIDEISSANLSLNEEDELNARRKILLNSSKLKDYCDNALDLLYRDDNAAVDTVSEALNDITDVEAIDSGFTGVSDFLSNACAIIEDAAQLIRSYADSIECSPDELEEIENRITLIYELKKKYGGSIENVLNYLETAKENYDKIINSEKILQEYKSRLNSVLKAINNICNKISELRINTANETGLKIQNTLRDLSMNSAEFKINVSNKEAFTQNGADDVEFLISANRGEPLKSLSKVASGGEMSRVMLALKTVLADFDNIETFIFDEIDAGISGRTAQKVAEKLRLIANNHQIICITHLPQIAAMADSNYLIEKSTEDNSTFTDITELRGEAVYNELARLIGGAAITEATIMAAKEMKEMASNRKENY